MGQTGEKWLGKKRTARIEALVLEANRLCAGRPGDIKLANGCSLVRGYAELVLGPQRRGEKKLTAGRLARLWAALEAMRARFDELPPPSAPPRNPRP